MRVYDFGLSGEAICLSNWHKYSRIATNFIFGIDIYYVIFTIRREVYNLYSLFTGNIQKNYGT